MVTEKINILKSEQSGDEWKFTVMVGDDDNAVKHEVTTEDEYYANLTGRVVSPEELVIKTFEYLLEQGTKESIMGSFDLSVVRDYYFNYEIEIKKRLGV